MDESYYAGANVDRYGFSGDTTPAPADVVEQEKQEAIDIADARAKDALFPPLPPLQDDPYSWGKAKEGQTPEQRRQEVVEIAARRRAQKTAQSDAAAIGQEQDPEKIFSQAQEATQQRLQRDVASKAQQQPGRITEAQQRSQRRGEAGQRVQRQQARSERQGKAYDRVMRDVGPSDVTIDTSTFADLPPRAPSLPQQREFGNQGTETFSQAHMEFDFAAERLLTALAKAVSACTARVEEVERWIELEGKK